LNLVVKLESSELRVQL